MFCVLGINHKTAAVGLREKLAVNADLAVETIAQIMHPAHVSTVVLISTCNRTEIYVEAESLDGVLRCLRRQYGINLRDLEKYTYLHFEQDAIRHLMRVACGLDSMVLGEVEILGQLKTAYQVAVGKGHVSKNISRLFQHTFSVAKKVRSATNIGLNPVSVAYLAVRLAGRIFAQIREQTVLIVGAGDTARLLLQHLRGAGVKKFYIANRTLQRSQNLALSLGLDSAEYIEYIKCIELSEIPDCLAQADIVVTATASPLPIIGKGMVELAIKTRKHKPMFMIDLAVPRDIEAQVRDISNIYLYCIDDLQAIATEHKQFRSSAAQQATLIIDYEAEKFTKWLASQQANSTIQAFRQVCAIQKDLALSQALRELNSGKDAKQVLERFAHVLLNRLIHNPTVQMREASTSGNQELLEVVRELFKL